MAFPDPNDPTGATPLYDTAPPPWQGDPSALAMPPPVPVPGTPDMGAPPVTPPQEVGQPTLDGTVPPPPPDLGVPPGIPGPVPELGLPGAPGGLPPVGGPGDFGVPPPVGSGGEIPPGPPPLAPDAITGAMPAPAFGSTGYGANLTPEQHYQQTVQAYAGHPQDIPDQGERDRAAIEMSTQHPVDFELYKQHLAARKAADIAAAQLAASEARYAGIKQDVENRQKADAITQVTQDAINTDAIKLANTPMDRNRWFRDKSLGSQIATVGVALIGGLLQGANGGRNTGMDWITGSIDKDIEDQKTDLENKRAGIGIRQGAVAQEFARTGNLYQAAEVVRLASYQVAMDHIATMQQDYDHRGTSFAVLGQGIQDLAARRAQALEVQRKEIHTETLADMKAEQERATAISTIEKNRQETALGWAKFGIDKAKAKTDAQVYQPEMLAQLMPPGSPIPKIAMNQKDYGEWLGNIKKGQEASLGGREFSIGGVAKVQRDADGNVTGTAYKPLTNKDGKEFTAPSTDEAKKLRTQKAGVDVVNSMVDQMISGIKDHGGATEFFKSPEWQIMQANKESLLFALHAAYGVEGFRPGVLEQMEKALGGQDPTKITVFEHNAVPGLQAAKKAVNTHFDANLRAANYTGEEYSPESAVGGTALPKLSGRTLQESEPGALDNLVSSARASARALAYPFEDNPQAGTQPDTGPTVGPSGLSSDDTATVQDMIRRYNTGTPATKEKIVAAIVAPLSAGRGSLNGGILGLLRNNSPDLYQLAVQALPPDQQEQEAQFRSAGDAFQKAHVNSVRRAHGLPEVP